jgi:hypothetical protein
MLMPSVYSRRYDQGFFRKDDSTLYVSRGIGGANPVRYRCPIEITRLVGKYKLGQNREERAKSPRARSRGHNDGKRRRRSQGLSMDPRPSARKTGVGPGAPTPPVDRG